MSKQYEGFVTACAISPRVRPAEPEYNAEQIQLGIDEARKQGAKIIVTPELSITGYTCGDLFLQDTLLEAAKAALRGLVAASAGTDEIVFVGLPYIYEGKLYNVAAGYADGTLLGLVPKTHIPNYGEYYELRHFAPAPFETTYVYDAALDEEAPIPFGTDILFRCAELPELVISAELCEDFWAPLPPSVRHAQAGATVIVNLSAGDETIGKDSYRRLLCGSQSGRLVSAYIYANAGYGESTSDMVFSGHSLIAENGRILGERKPFADGAVLADIDIRGLAHDRRFLTSFGGSSSEGGYTYVGFSQKQENSLKYREVEAHPFVPSGTLAREERCEEIVRMQTSGLMKRLEASFAKKAVIGISGGLDSTLALLITCQSMKALGRPFSDIVAVTMPGPGTTKLTKNSAERLCEAIGVELLEIPIENEVSLHLKDIGVGEDDRSNTYENAQARVRTLILMNLANKHGGIVVGTGDLSELALGWATYNGDHMSMYGVNCSVPKTLVRYIISHISHMEGFTMAEEILAEILEIPVSPELLPPVNGEIAQKTEEIIGPYELHDFFLYHMLRWGRKPTQIFALAVHAFSGVYDEEAILSWLKLFIRRFFSSQFKRNTLPDGPKIGTVTLSPRGDWRMPADASAALWLSELESIV
ncbi:MAG: NAD(+) synthase [Clostridiales Family XIII bacterium]|jgi:NAD+ synthase (glutamine-hydrolysing)|nr:NAD(+) synthase [Clostridiales Family XIII bacterium]